MFVTKDGTGGFCSDFTSLAIGLLFTDRIQTDLLILLLSMWKPTKQTNIFVVITELFSYFPKECFLKKWKFNGFTFY